MCTVIWKTPTRGMRISKFKLDESENHLGFIPDDAHIIGLFTDEFAETTTVREIIESGGM